MECNMNCKKDKGRKCGAGWRNSIFDIQKIDVSQHIAIDRFVTYQERMVILAYVQWELKLITETQFITEIKRFKFTKATAEKLFQEKGKTLQTFESSIKVVIWK
jgi:hypothetical protein